MKYYYTIYSMVFLYMFLLNNKGKLDVKMFTGVGNKDKKVFVVELCARLCFMLLIVAVIYEVEKNGFVFNIYAVIMQLSALFLFYIAKKTMKESWATNLHSASKLVTTGVFAYSRNPVYVAYFLLFFSLVFVNYTIFVFVLLAYMISFHLLVLQEEKFLIKEFGACYEAYLKQVRRYI